MEPQMLTDKDQFPVEEIIFAHIGKSRLLWDSVFDYIHANHPDFIEQWRYYNDGKSWLLKTTRKSKTVFWLAVQKDTFIMTFYFTEKAKDAIAGSNISEELKEQFISGKRFGKIRGISIIFERKKNVEDAIALMEIKLKLK
ncbi:MAG: DUF3788 family protein [Ignavibacteriales bacterium]